MRKIVFTVATILLTVGLLTVGCAQKAPPPAATTEGTITDVNPEQGTVTVTTEEGPQTFPIGPSTILTFAGKACTLQELADQEASGQELTCTVVYDQDNEGNVFSFNVAPKPKPASVEGTIKGVDLEKSTITLKTASGEKVYEVDPNTGIILGGVSCDLALIDALVGTGADLLCTLIYTIDDQGKAVYVDAVKPSDITSVQGTITKVDLPGSSITVKTAQGDKVYEVDPQTGLAIGGQVCDLALLDALLASGENLTCTIISSVDQQGNAIYVDIANPEGLASVEGTIKKVDLAKSTITVKTAQGDKVYEVDPETGIVVGGVVCDLAFIAELAVTGSPLECSILSSVDQQGNAIYVDVANPPGITSVEGTITKVDLAKSTITVKTAQGDKVYEVDPETGIVVGGQVCDLAFINELAVTGDSLACTILSTVDQQGNAIYVDVASPPDLTSVEGTITKVDVAKSFVTIRTDKGERTFEVDPRTGLFLSGEVCSLDQVIQADAQFPGENLACTVLFYLDEQGQAVYIDVSPLTP